MSATRYGDFSADGREYVITDWRTPRPWANVIANPRAGLVVSQTGSGFAWVDNSQLAVLTRWTQDLTHDASGRFLYLRDAASGAVWSLAPAPCFPAYERFACRHGLGYTVFETALGGIAARWTLLAHPEQPAELWLVELSSTRSEPARLELVPFVEWCCGVTPSSRREFAKLFLETRFDAGHRAVLATSHMWDVPSARWGHWNTSFPYVAALASSAAVAAAQGDRTRFVGRSGDVRAPEALDGSAWEGAFGRHDDAAAALRCPLEIAPGGRVRLAFALAAAGSWQEAGENAARLADPAAIEAALAATTAAWNERLAAHRVETPDPPLDRLVNDWARYQAISARLWARAGYYQQSGAYGFRDQLQDAQVWLTVEPARCREQIRLHAAHQFADGSVVHWWHPLTEQGHVTRMTDDLLWLAFVTASYVKETGRLDVLAEPAPFLDDPEPAPLASHVRRAFERVFSRTSERGLPYIGAGDWNDGLSAAGLDEKGESVWLAHFLALLLAEWGELWARAGKADLAAEYRSRRAALAEAINRHGWDGAWYLRGTLDDGSPLGSASCRVAQIFLNAQTWAVLADVAPPERAAACMRAVRERLVSEAGALLLAPAFDRPEESIGYITRYAPGLRENGGVYTHAATWAIAAAARVKDAELVGRLLAAVEPSSKDPERYWAEPYVLPGNVDGPGSPHHGRAGWTWYTGSAAWLHRVVAEWVLGVRPEWEGLRFDPCLPPAWPRATMVRPYRGCTFEVAIERGPGPAQVTVDGSPVPGGLFPGCGGRGRVHVVRVRIGEG